MMFSTHSDNRRRQLTPHRRFPVTSILLIVMRQYVLRPLQCDFQKDNFLTLTQRSVVEAFSGAIEWEGEVIPGQPHMTFNGTAEEVYNQILAINPDYKGGKANDNVEARSSLEQRDDVHYVGSTIPHEYALRADIT